MVIKWTPENDQLLLLKILETSQVNANPKAISDAWPSDSDARPTPRAITERLVKIRALCKANNGTHFTVASSQTKNPNRNNTRGPKTSNGRGTSSSAPSTPRGRKPTAPVGGNGDRSVGKGGSSTGKRKRSGEYVKVESESEAEGDWSAGSETGSEETPSKRVKANGKAYGNGNGNGKGLVGDEDGFGETDVDVSYGMMAPDQFAAYQFDGVQEDQYV